MDDIDLNISGLRPRAVPLASRDDLIRREQRHQLPAKARGAVGKRALETSGSQPQLAKPLKRIKRSRVADAVPKIGEIEVPKQGAQSEVFKKSAAKKHKQSKGSATPVLAAQKNTGDAWPQAAQESQATSGPCSFDKHSAGTRPATEDTL